MARRDCLVVRRLRSAVRSNRGAQVGRCFAGSARQLRRAEPRKDAHRSCAVCCDRDCAEGRSRQFVEGCGADCVSFCGAAGGEKVSVSVSIGSAGGMVSSSAAGGDSCDAACEPLARGCSTVKRWTSDHPGIAHNIAKRNRATTVALVTARRCAGCFMSREDAIAVRSSTLASR